jgi:hypothetical protein
MDIQKINLRIGNLLTTPPLIKDPIKDKGYEEEETPPHEKPILEPTPPYPKG